VLLTSECPISSDKAEAYLFARLNGRDAVVLEQHLIVCEECRRVLSEERAIVRAFRSAAHLTETE
jgi:predicted anti-sigma-YlaC factor YlaD